MNSIGPMDDISPLYDQFIRSIRENNGDAVRRIYQHLRQAGRPLKEILDEASRGANAGHNTLEDLLLGPEHDAQLLSDEASIKAPGHPPSLPRNKGIFNEGDPAAEQSKPDPVISPPLIQSAPTSGIRYKIGSSEGRNGTKTKQHFKQPLFILSHISNSRGLWFGFGVLFSLISVGSLVHLGRIPFDLEPSVRRFSAVIGPVSTTPFVESKQPASSPSQPRSGPAEAPGTLVSEPSDVESAQVDMHAVTKAQPAQTAIPVSPSDVISHVAPKPTSERSPTHQTLSSGDIALLLARGDAMFGSGDIVSARQFYERAAEGDEGQAALRLGVSYDPSFLEQVNLGGARADLHAAASWYRRARDLGARDAEVLLNQIGDK